MAQKFTPPDPHLVGSPLHRTPPRLGRAAALMAAGIALLIASAWLREDGLHPLATSRALPWAI